MHGIVAYMIYDRSINADRYMEFLQTYLRPAMQPFPGRNSIVIHDNASFHRGNEIRSAISEWGGVLVALPTYSPDYNPIELLFGWLKKWLRDFPHIVTTQPMLCFVEAMRHVPQEMFIMWARHCGYKFQE